MINYDSVDRGEIEGIIKKSGNYIKQAYAVGVLARFYARMILVLTLLIESFITIIALIRLVAGVTSPMDFQNRFAIERLMAIVALELIFARVHFVMDL